MRAREAAEAKPETPTSMTVPPGLTMARSGQGIGTVSASANNPVETRDRQRFGF